MKECVSRETKGSQLIKKFLALYWTRKFITVFIH